MDTYKGQQKYYFIDYMLYIYIPWGTNAKPKKNEY